MDLALLQAATDRFGGVLAQVTPEQYGWATPCPDWSVVDLVDHVVGGNRWAVLLLAGAEGRASWAEVQHLPKAADRRTDFAVSVTAQREAFEAAGPDVAVTHPFGATTAAGLLRLRIGDVIVHTWDLTRALGVDERLPDELVRAGLDIFAADGDRLVGTGAFGAGPDGAPPPVDDQQRLLHLAGRRP
jgi:uncharacterized protein (TIGR03086 family)